MRCFWPAALLLVPCAGLAQAEPDPQRRVEAYAATLPRGNHTASASTPTQSGQWYVTVERLSGWARARVKLNGQSVLRPRDVRAGLGRVPVTVQATNALEVRVIGQGTVRVRLEGVVPEAALSPGAGQRVGRVQLHDHTLTQSGWLGLVTHQASVTTPSADGLFEIRTTNGPQGAPRFALGFVRWNQRLVDLLTKTPQTVSTPVAAQANNQLKVTALGFSGAQLRVEVLAWLVDEEAPTVSFLSPAPGSTPGPSDPITLSFSDAVTGILPGSFKITLNGTDVSSAFQITSSGATATLADLPAGTLQAGTNTLLATVSDRACNQASATLSFNQGGAGPQITHPGDLVRECTGPAGARVAFTVSTDPGASVTCAPASGSVFPLGTTSVTCTATGPGGTSTASFLVTVRDTRAPVLGQAQVAFQAEAALAAGSPGPVASGDLNGDGRQDLVVGDASAATATVFLNVAGQLVAQPATSLPQVAGALHLADLDGDGDLDLVAALPASDQVAVLLGTGSGTFGAATTHAVGDDPRAVVTADLDRDGRLDLVSADRGSSRLSILLGDGAGGFGAAQALPTQAAPVALAALDLNVDGFVDLVAGGGNALAVHLGTAAGPGPPTSLAVGSDVRQVRAGDLNGDGWPDLVTADFASNTLTQFLSDGSGGFLAASSQATAAGPLDLGLVDLDGDGDLDLVSLAATAQQVSHALNTGNGSFGARVDLPTSGVGRSLALVDVNGDGRGDLLHTQLAGLGIHLGDPGLAPVTAEATGPSGAVVSYGLPGVQDACDASPSLACVPAPGSTFALGTTTVTCTATDAAGNVSRVQRSVVVVDTTPPALGPLPNLTVEQTSAAGAVVNYSATATDLVDPNPSVVCAPPSGSTFPAGTTTVTCTATDAAGNSVSQTFTVTVQDTTPPSLTQPPNLTVEQTGAAGAVVTYALPSAVDAVDPNPSVVCTPASGSTFPAGTTTVTCTATDAAGNSASVSFTVTVVDTTPPSLTQPPNLTVEQTSAAGAVVSYALPSASDAVDPNPGVVCAPASGSTFPAGTTTVTCTATDAAGNSASVSFTVTVQDTTAPTLAQPPNLTVEQTSPAGAVVNYALPAASDTVDPNPSVVCAPAPGSTFPAGTTTVTCTATDAAGNSASVSFTVTVQDTTAPALTQPPNLTVPATSPTGAVVTYAAPTATDAADPNPSVACAPASGSTFAVGTTTVTCTATDAAGNSASVSFTVTVTPDTTPPSLTQPPNLTVEQTSPSGAVVTYAAPTATDDVDPNPTVVCSPASGATFPAGTTTVTCTATDAAGNSASVTFTVTVQDTTPPALTQPPNLTVEQTSPAGAVVTYPAPSATDAADPAPVVSCTPASGATFAAGTTTVTCTATDAAGNSASVSFTVTVQDTLPPSLALTPAGGASVPSGTVALAANYSDSGSGVDLSSFSATLDAVDVSSSFTVGASQATATVSLSAGQHTLVVTLRDAAGNQVSQTSTFTVLAAPDTTPPTLAIVRPVANECVGAPRQLSVTYADAGSGVDVSSFAATLNGADVSASFTTSAAGAVADVSAINSSLLVEGPATLSVSVRDVAGNQSQASVNFNLDVTPPTLSLTPASGATVNPTLQLVASYADPPNSGATCGIDLGSFRATLDGADATSQFVIGSGQATSDVTLSEGVHTLSVTIADLGGNAVTQQVTFTVVSPLIGFQVSLSADPSAVQVASPNSLTLRALLTGGQTATDFTGFVLVSTSEGLPPLDGLLVEFTAADQGQVTIPDVALFQSLGPVVITANDVDSALSGTLQATVVVTDPVAFPPPPATLGEDGALRLEGFSFPGELVELVVDGQVVASTVAGANGTYVLQATLPPGAQLVSVRATDPGTGQVRSSTPTTVTVPAPTTTGLTADPLALSLAIGESRALTVLAQLSTNTTQDVTAQASYQSSAGGIAAVDTQGRVQALGVGAATITVSFDGQQTTVPVQVGVTRLVTSSPAQGEGSVAVTRETILRFSSALDVATVTSAALFAEFGGQRLSNAIHVSPDAKVVTLFYSAPLPASARVRVTVDGSVLKSSSGAQVDVDGDGAAGGLAQIDFDTLTLTVVPGTSVCGRVFASELAPGGGSINVPLEGVKITVDGQESTLFATTDQFGNFRLEPAPAGRFFVHIDGRQATNSVPAGAYYPFVGKPLESVPGEERNVGNFFLPLVNADVLQPASLTQDTTLTFSPTVLANNPELAGVELTVAADSLFADNGARGGQVGIAPVASDRLPGPPPFGDATGIVFTFQTDGPTNLDVPVAVKWPNTGGLPPGTRRTLWSFNHDLGRWEAVAVLVVSADGLFLVTEPGTGIVAPGWHTFDPSTEGKGGRTKKDKKKKKPKEEATGTPEPTASRGGSEDCDADAVCREGFVLLHSGELRVCYVDNAIPGRGDLSWKHCRTYRSRTKTASCNGNGYSTSYVSEQLNVEPNGDVTVQNGQGRSATYTNSGPCVWMPPEGHFRSLIQLPNGDYVLRSPDGFKKVFREDGKLTRYEDRYGHKMLFEYDGEGNLDLVVDSYGREIDYQWATQPDGVDRLVKIVDFMGRETRYTYDSAGNLTEVRTPVVVGTTTGNDFPNGRVTRYTYSSGFSDPVLNGNLLTITRPEEVATGGPASTTFTYGTNASDPVSYDKVLTVTEGGTNASGIPAGGTKTFVYEQLNQGVPPGNLRTPRGKATITERNGNQWEYFVNEKNHHIITRHLTRTGQGLPALRPGEPAFYETQSFFDADGQLVRRVFPEGNELRLSYATGSRGQQYLVTETRRVADAARGGGEDLVTKTTYEPLFNRVLTVIDPRGNAAGYVAPIGTASAARYTTHFFYDYQEHNNPIPEATAFGLDLSGVTRGLGDLNEDGRTDQSAGRPVKVEAPSVQLLPGSNEATRLGSTTQVVVSQMQWNDSGQLTAAIDPEGNVTDYVYFPENDPDGDGRSTLSPWTVVGTTPRGYLKQVIVDARTSTRRSSTTPPVALTTEMRYDEVGNLVSVKNPRGVVTEFEVTHLNETVKVTRGADVAAALANGQLLTGETPLRYVQRTRFDHNGRVVKTEVENRDGNTPGVGSFIERSVAYDILDNPLSSSVEVDATTTLTTTFRYDPDELLVRVTKPEGNQVATVYDERNLVFKVTAGFGAPEASTIQVDYDKNGNRVKITDAQDNDGDGQPEATTLAYDGFDRLKEVTDALGNRAVTSYDVASNVTRLQAFGHPAGQPSAANVLLSDVKFLHDELRRVYQTDESLFVSSGFTPIRTPQLLDQNSDGLVTTKVEYDALSRPTFGVEDDNEVSATVYDGASRVIETRDALGNKLLRAYDQNSNVVRLTSLELSAESLVPAETFVTQYVYDQLDRLVRVTDNAGQTSRFSYDSRDNLIGRSDPVGSSIPDPLSLFPVAGTFKGGVDPGSQINAAGNTKTWFYDGLDRRTRVTCDLRVGGVGSGAIDTSNPTNPDGQVSLVYQWDKNSRLSARVDDNGNKTSFGYDALDRQISQTNADTKSWAFAYDRDHNVTQVTDPNGTVVTKVHDVLNRLRSTAVARASGVGGTTAETFEYDGLSRLTKCTDDNGGAAAAQSCTYVYDSLSRLLEETFTGAKTISNVYTGDSKRLQCTYPGGRVIKHTFDAIDRIKRTLDGSAGDALIAEANWIGPGLRELKRTYGNGTVYSFVDPVSGADTGYDAVQRIVRLRHLLPGGTVFVDRQYTYNRASVRTSEKRNADGGQEDRYSYDSLYRVTQTLLDQGGTGTKRDLQSIAYQLDGVGNRRKVDTTTTSAGSASEAFQVNAVNEYTQKGTTPRVHSDNGNLTDNGQFSFVYDYKNRLIGVFDKATSNPVAAYLYFCDGRRAKKIVYSQASPGTIERQQRFYYDGAQVCEEANDAGVTELTWVYSPVYVDEPCQYVRTAAHPLGAGTFFLHQNARADVVAVTDAGGAVAERQLYDDYGRSFDGVSKQPVAGSAVGNPYGFQGRRLDAETGLYYFRARYYDPETGRFIQRDPVWDPGNFGNQYSFVGNCPSSAVDPMGEDGGVATLPVAAGAGSGLGTAGATAGGVAAAPWVAAGAALAAGIAIGIFAVEAAKAAEGASRAANQAERMARVLRAARIAVKTKAVQTAAQNTAKKYLRRALKALLKEQRAKLKCRTKDVRGLPGHHLVVLYFKDPPGLVEWVAAVASGNYQAAGKLKDRLIESFRGARYYRSQGHKDAIKTPKMKDGWFSPYNIQDTEKLAIMDAIADKKAGFDHNVQAMFSISVPPLPACKTCRETMGNFVHFFSGNRVFYDSVVSMPGNPVPNQYWNDIKRMGRKQARSGLRRGVGSVDPN